MSTREIITIQCGQYSNFIGTHWWNLQESAFCYDPSSQQPREIANDCMFREGLTLNGEQTYTPRLVAVDLSGSLKTLTQKGHLYPEANQHLAWEGCVEKHETEPLTKNEFLTDLQLLDSGKMEVKKMEDKVYELQSSVEVWSDYLRIHLHPKSLLTVPCVYHGSDSEFQVYPAGMEVWDSRFKECFEDRLHFFVEECDSLQGFHLLVDQDNGFGAIGSCFAEELADEFSRKGIISFTSSSKTQPLDQATTFNDTLLNHSLCLDNLCTHSSLVCPLSLLVNPWRSHTQLLHRSLPLVHFEHSLPFHSAAVFAVGLETASLIYRVHQPPLSLPSMADIISRMGRKVCGMGVCLPLSLSAESTLLSELDVTPLHTQLQPLTPFCGIDDLRWSQVVSVRGIPPDYPLCPSTDERHSYCRQHISLALSSHLSHHFPSSSTSTHFTIIHKPLTLGNPFPSILPQDYYKTRQVPTGAAFVSQSGIGDMLSALSSELKRLNISKFPSFASTCLDSTSYAELKERLVCMEEHYRTELQLDESSDSD